MEMIELVIHYVNVKGVCVVVSFDQDGTWGKSSKLRRETRDSN